jgi:recombination protein RecT
MAETKNSKAVVKYDNISDQVLQKIKEYETNGGLVIPKNYSVTNQMKAAWLVLQDTEDKDHHKALEVCTKGSIAVALLDMVLQGLSVAKNQGYFIVYGNKLEFQRSYFGTVSLARRCGGIKCPPVANVIYKGDEFVYNIDPVTGHTTVVKHGQKIENIKDENIVAAYATVTLANGERETTIMTIDQIRKAWNQGATKGNSPAHKNFPGEMCKKTVIGRACKMIINSSDDAWLYEGMPDNETTDTDKEQRDALTDHGASERPAIGMEDAEYEEVATNGSKAAETQSPEQPEPEPQAENANDDMPY